MKKIIYTLFLTQVLLISSCNERKNTETSSVITEASESGITITKKQFNNSGMALERLAEKPFPITVQTNGMIDVPALPRIVR